MRTMFQFTLIRSRSLTLEMVFYFEVLLEIIDFLELTSAFFPLSTFPAAMLGTQLNYLVTENKIQKNCIIRLDKYLCNTISGRRIVIILVLEVLAEDIGHVIGLFDVFVVCCLMFCNCPTSSSHTIHTHTHTNRQPGGDA